MFERASLRIAATLATSHRRWIEAIHFRELIALLRFSIELVRFQFEVSGQFQVIAGEVAFAMSSLTCLAVSWSELF